jgi:DNA-binding response OmpR family regulator
MTDAGTIVVIEDDPAIADLVELYLRREGFRVAQAATGERGLEVIGEQDPVLVVLDVGLAGAIDGLEVCRRLRVNSRVPVVMVTARDDELDRVLGLELGADDYLSKPFSPRELVARVRAVLRRSAPVDQPSGTGAPTPIELGALVIDRARHEVRVDAVPVALAAREYDLLVHLAEHRGLALSRRQLLDGVWGADWVGDERTVDVHVRQLRRKLGVACALDTVRGHGYRLG